MKWLVIAATLVAAGCATPAPPATDAEKDATIKALLVCLEAQAIVLDDHASDAMTIAAAIAPFCAKEFADAEEAQARGMNPQAERFFLADAQRDRVQVATSAVLKERTTYHR